MDLSWAQATWNKLFERIGLVSSVYFLLRRIRDELKRNDIIVDEYWDPNEYLTNWALSGVQLFSNTDEAGRLYVDIAANAANWDIEIFSDSTRLASVAKATNIVAGATGTLAEQNDSGLSGTVDLHAGIAADAIIWLRPRVGLLKQIDDMVIDDTFDSFLKTDMMSQLTNVVNSIGTGLSSVESFTRRYLIPYLAKKMETAESSVSNPVETATSGVITYEDAGILRDLIDAMNDDTNAGAQSVDTPAIGSSVESADADNVGTGTVGTPSYFEYMEGCMVTLECVTETIGSEAFEVTARRKDDGTLISSQNNLTIKKAYLSTDIGIKSMTLIRTVVVGDPGAGAGEWDHFTDWLISGETSTNTTAGVIYSTYNSVTKLLNLYSDSGRASLVAHGTWDGVDGNYVVLSEDNDSGMTGSVKIEQKGAADPATTATLQCDLKPFKEEDKIYLDFTRSDHSFFELLIGRLYKSELPFSLAASTLSDLYANRGYSGLDPEDDS